MSSQAAYDLVIEESRLSEESRLRDWLDLWDADGLYWIPIGDPAGPDEKTVAIARDSPAELEGRISRLESGLVHSQVPPSRWSRVWGPLQVRRADAVESDSLWDGHDVAWAASGNFHIVEMRRGQRSEWAGRADYLFTQAQGSPNLKIFRKTVWLVDRDMPLPPLMFLI
jgi:3-phenylpropionate/cinnamic acid dioxygenase small subunit